MDAIVKSTAGPGLELQQVPVPKPGPGEVLIKIHKTAICGTDVHIYNWDPWAQQHIKPPMTIGHEYVGEIAELGAGVTGLHIGQRVSGEGHITCHRCRNCHSGNQLLDVMLHKYIITCELRGIRFEYDIRSCNLSQLADIDLVAILGNLMDNAVSAAEQSEEKYISLSTCHRNSYSVIDLTNSCAAPPVQRGGRLLTTKADKLSHGFGMKSVEKTIRKYQGDFNWDYHAGEKRFTATVMLTDRPAEAAP